MSRINQDIYWTTVCGEGVSARRIVSEFRLTRERLEPWLIEAEKWAWKKRGHFIDPVPPVWAKYREGALAELRAALDSTRPGAGAAALAKIQPKRQVRIWVDLDEPDFAILVKVAGRVGQSPAVYVTRVLRGAFAEDKGGDFLRIGEGDG